MLVGTILRKAGVTLAVIVCLASVQVGKASPASSGRAVAQPEVLAQVSSQGRAIGFVNLEHAQILERALAAAPLGAGRAAGVLEVTKPAYRALKQRVLARAGAGVRVLRDYDALATMLVEFRSAGALGSVLSDPEVASVGANGADEAHLDQSLPLIRQPQAAQIRQGGLWTSVAVLDTGVDYTKAAFGSCTEPNTPSACRVVVSREFDSETGDNDRDDDGHGTNVAGIVLGVAPDAEIVALDVFRKDRKSYRDDQVSAINWVVGNAATYRIESLNMSLGSGSFTSSCDDGDPRQTAFADARAVGVLPVVSAGNSALMDTTNDGVNNPTFQNGIARPACIPGTVSVGAVYDSNFGSYSGSCTDATTAADRITCFSQSASILTLLAPGARITAAGSTYSGTSQAAPHVAGAAAVLGAANPSATADQIQSALAKNGPLIYDARNGASKRRLDLFAALTITFESPSLGARSRMISNRHSSTGVSFSAISATYSDEVVGLVKNSATSACAEPSDSNQKLGTGRAAFSDGGIGLSGFPIKASLMYPLGAMKGGRVFVGAQFQALAGTTLRIRMYDSAGTLIGTGTAVAGPNGGTCGYPGNQRARTTVSVAAYGGLSYAVLDTVEAGRVFVIDNFRYGRS